ncbi:MAG: acetylserine transporter [Legionellales bacterium RIFCSPHIGHO2_12_FULL_42_9]|nr:MAG: acetylserine transporter [Legionellales bacterium RIFCSPHIGHO2_12_FULL_42_9]
MTFFHVGLAILLVAVWGFNFIAIQFALQDVSPLMLCVLRFFLACFPGLFFVKCPQVSWRWLAIYGLFTFALQFLFLFLGMWAGVTPGLAGLLAQMQVFFSLFFAAFFLKESLTRWQVIGACVSFSGVMTVFMNVGGDVSVLGFFFVLGAAASWGAGNLMTKKIGPVDAMGLVIWASLFACIPLSMICFVIEGPRHMWMSVQHMSWQGGVALLYIVYASTWLGYGLWNWLLGRYFIATVVPFTFLVPVFAMIGSMVMFDESLQGWKITAGLLVVLGLLIHLFGARLARKFVR